MPLHRLRSITIGVPSVDPVRAFYRDFGLAETRPGHFETSDGGEQLRIEAAPRRALLELTVGVDDADDLGRAAAALAKLGIEASRDARTLRSVEPISGVRAELRIEPRIAQKPPVRIPINAPGETLRLDARSPAVLGAARCEAAPRSRTP